MRRECSFCNYNFSEEPIAEPHPCWACLRKAAKQFRERARVPRRTPTELAEIEQEYRRVIEESPDDVRALLKLGDLAGRRGHASDACGRYRRVAEIYQRTGFCLKAIAVHHQVFKLDETELDRNALADAYREIGLPEDAAATLRGDRPVRSPKREWRCAFCDYVFEARTDDPDRRQGFWSEDFQVIICEECVCKELQHAPGR